MEITNWAPEHSAALRDFFDKGKSFSQIARAINAKFKTTYSRNAALGRAKRMGLDGGRPAGAAGARATGAEPVKRTSSRRQGPGVPLAKATVRDRQAGQTEVCRGRAAPSLAG